ncbi:amphiphysin [Caerostris extrusa]|uniref:Amphiphysin n=1 Tax=Caerostris extrusa TaxID=172846 RepID=A0AAV4P0S1_CAEEX|nr:amphiphysin [Caerostris extrusa]
MSELNPFSRVLQKHAGRAKERLLQNLGKADRTTDEDFDLHVKNFSKQQNAVMRLHKEFKNYYMCIRAMQAARRSLMDTVCELYEPCWDGVEQFLFKTEVSNKNFDDFCDKINCELVAPVGTYLCQFPEFTNKISKRNRKLLDYDNSRHNLQNLETMKKREETKIAKAKEQLEEARNHFEVINSELHEELPALYDSRVSFFATHLRNLFQSEAGFHKQDAALFIDINGILEKLNDAYKKGSLMAKSKICLESMENGAESKLPDPDYFLSKDNNSSDNEIKIESEKLEECKIEEKKVEESKVQEDGSSVSTNESIAFSTPPTTTERNMNLEMLSEMSIVDEDVKSENKIKGEASPSGFNVLYQVQGTYKYAAEDSDELSFNVGDIIDVVEYDDPEEQEEGWLMGVFNGKKGLFPANFTSRI